MLVVLAALAVRVIVLGQLGDHPLLQPTGQLDSAVFVELGQRIAGGDLALAEATGGEPFFLAPLYAYFLGLVFALSGGSMVAAKAVQAGLGAAAVALVFAGGRPWVGTRAALFAAGLLAVCGPVVFHETLLLQAALDPFLMALALVLVSWALGSGRGRDWLLAGAGVGLFALNRPNAVLWGLALVLALPLVSRSRAGMTRAATLGLGLALAVAPATLRNLAVSGEPVLLTSHGGLNLYIGNNADADGTYHHVPGITPDIRGQVRDARRLAEEAAGHPLAAREVDAHFRQRSLDWVVGHPAEAARLFLRKLAYVFSASEITLNYSYAYFRSDEPSLLRWLVVGAWLLVPLGLVGLADRWWSVGVAASRDPAEPRDGFGQWALVVPAYALSVALFFVSSRYRLPLLVPLTVGAGYALARVTEGVRSRSHRTLLTYAAALAPLFALTLWPWGLDDGRAYAREDRVVRLIQEGHLDEARALVERAAPAHPDPAILFFRAGRALQAGGRPAQALPLLERSLANDPGRPEVRLALGQCLLDEGRAAEAEPHLRAAFEAGVRRDLSGFDLARAQVATGRTREAGATLGDLVALELDPESRRTVVRFALELGELEPALHHLDRAVDETPDDADAHEHRGLVLARMGRGAEARLAFGQALRLDPDRASAHLNLAALHAQAGRFGEARASARRALELRPGYPQARALLEQLP